MVLEGRRPYRQNGGNNHLINFAKPFSRAANGLSVNANDGTNTRFLHPRPQKIVPEILVRFLREVRAEARKISWTSRKETWITSVMVLIMVVTASLFLFVVDLVLRFGIAAIIKLGS